MGGMPGNIYTPANQRPMRPSSKEGSGGVHIRQELPSPMQVKKNYTFKAPGYQKASISTSKSCSNLLAFS